MVNKKIIEDRLQGKTGRNGEDDHTFITTLNKLAGTRYVVRIPMQTDVTSSAKYIGTYKTLNEAFIARDYAEIKMKEYGLRK